MHNFGKLEERGKSSRIQSTEKFPDHWHVSNPSILPKMCILDLHLFSFYHILGKDMLGSQVIFPTIYEFVCYFSTNLFEIFLCRLKVQKQHLKVSLVPRRKNCELYTLHLPLAY